VVLEEKSIAFDWIPVVPHSTNAEFNAISPLGKIPAYQDDKVALCDSSAISFYLEKAHPLPALYPADAVNAGRALWLEEFADTALIDAMRVVFTEAWLKPYLLGETGDDALVKQALEVQLPPLLNYLEAQMTENDWMVGGQFSIADISVASGWWNMQLAGYAPDNVLYPKLASHAQRALSRPSFKKCALFEQDFIVRRKAKLEEAAKLAGLTIK
jgi:glutathione S-transferase